METVKIQFTMKQEVVSGDVRSFDKSLFFPLQHSFPDLIYIYIFLFFKEERVKSLFGFDSSDFGL